MSRRINLATLKLAFVCWLIFFPLFSYSQVGGERSFEFINLPSNAGTAALGGVNVSHTEHNIEHFLSNPALLDSVGPGRTTLSYLGFLADTKLSNLAFAQKIRNLGVFGFGVQYMNFGKIEGFDEVGIEQGTFNANEFALVVGYAHRISFFSLGTNFRFASSGIAGFRANALLFDIGGSFQHPHKELTVGLTFKNIGFYLSDYTTSAASSTPFDVQLGVTFKPEHMPVRFSTTLYNLYKGDLTFFNEDSEISLINTEAGVFDKVFRHINLGVEIIITKNIHLRTGYNHLIRKELRLATKSGAAGFSFGFLVRIKTFELAYTRAMYHVAGGGNHFTIGANVNTIFKKKSTI